MTFPATTEVAATGSVADAATTCAEAVNARPSNEGGRRSLERKLDVEQNRWHPLVNPTGLRLPLRAAGRYGEDLGHARQDDDWQFRSVAAWGLTRADRQSRNAGLRRATPWEPVRSKRLPAGCEEAGVAFEMLHIAGMPPVYDRWLNGVVPTWASLKADRIDAMRGMPAWEDGAIRLAFDLTDDEIAHSPMVQNAFVLMRAADEADGLELTARGNLTLGTVSAMHEAMNWPGCLFEQKWRAGKRLREGYVEELRLVRELVTMDSLLIRKDGRLRVGATGRHVLKGARERVQRNFFRNCFWEVSLSLFGGPECGNWPQPQIGLALWSLSTTGDRWQDTETLMRLSVLPDEGVLRNPDWVAPVLFVLRLLRPLRWFGLVECRGEDATRTGNGEWRKTPLFDRFVQFDPKLFGTGQVTAH